MPSPTDNHDQDNHDQDNHDQDNHDQDNHDQDNRDHSPTIHDFGSDGGKPTRGLTRVVRLMPFAIVCGIAFSPLLIMAQTDGEVESDSAPPAAEESTDASDEETIDESPKISPLSISPDAVDLPESVLADVPLKSLDITMEEASAYYAVLNHAAQMPLKRLRSAAFKLRQSRHEQHEKFRQRPLEDFPQFVDLFQHPEAYRGKPVTWHGYSRRVRSIVADENPYGIGTLHEIWLFTDDSQNNPLVVVCTEVPRDLPQGDQLLNGISVTGYFFKLYGYDDSGEDKRLAPMILAHKLEWNPPTVVPGASSWWLYGVSLAVLAGLILSFWYVQRRDRLSSPLSKSIRQSPEKIDLSPDAGDTPPARNDGPIVIDDGASN